MDILICKHIQVSYDDRTVIEDLTFNVGYGDYLCIVGDNGAGKSTLIKCILGLKPISGGELIFDEELRQNQIGYVSQNLEVNEDFPASVLEVVTSGCLNRHGIHPFYSKKEKFSAKEILNKLGLADLEAESFKNLSGGQQRRVLLARALMASEKLLILDEPVSSLDPIATDEFYNTMKMLNDEGMTLIMVSHDIHTAVHKASHILHLSNQMPNFFGTREEYLGSKIGHSYLGSGGNCTQCNKRIGYAGGQTGENHEALESVHDEFSAAYDGGVK